MLICFMVLFQQEHLGRFSALWEIHLTGVGQVKKIKFAEK